MKLTSKQRRKLDHVRLLSQHHGMYPGLQIDMLASKDAKAFYEAGLIRTFIPHNPAHKERWVITPAGLAALEAE